MDERKALIGLSIAGVQAYQPMQALMNYFGSFCEVFQSEGAHIEKALGRSQSTACAVLKASKNFSELLERIHEVENQFTVLTCRDLEYPERLLQIYDPPWVLYAKGEPDFSKPMLAMVGARRATSYGKWAAEKFAGEVSQYGIGIISGLAYGIDAASHGGCIDKLGYTVGVLGGGIDGVYPSGNRHLFKQLEDKGCIISEYPPGITPQKHFFPARNRIISGLSHGVFVVEAGEKSGALITADFAMEQGRDVFALPGNINHRMSTGTNRLLRDGARMVLETEDLVEPLGINAALDRKVNTELTDRLPDLTEKEKRVYQVIQSEPTHPEKIVIQLQYSIAEINGILTVLELKGLVRQLPGKTFTVC